MFSSLPPLNFCQSLALLGLVAKDVATDVAREVAAHTVTTAIARAEWVKDLCLAPVACVAVLGEIVAGTAHHYARKADAFVRDLAEIRIPPLV